ncbi:MAG: TonB-dependent receptor [Bacteroidales bacterium]|nr:TonB-dependent receptor [Bacteroidales bacterium]
MILFNKLLLICFTFLTATSFAQNISGTVVDIDNNQLPYSNIALYPKSGGKLITGTVSDENGLFIITVPKNYDHNSLIMVTSFVGMVNDTLCLGDTDINNIVVKLSPDYNLLGEVSISAYKSPIKMEGSTIVADVDHSVLSKMDGIDQLMNKIPFVSSQEGMMEVFGRGAAAVYINNRLVLNSETIRQLAPSNIKKIEVITNPDSKYGAEVSSVVKIYTKTSQNGFGGSARLRFRINEKITENLLLSGVYAKRGWQFAANFNLSNAYFEQNSFERTIIHTNQSVLENDIDYQYEHKFCDVWAGVDYAFSESTNMGGSVGFFNSDETNRYRQTMRHYVDGGKDFVGNAKAPTNNIPRTKYANYYFTTSFSDIDFDFSYDYVSLNSIRHNDYTESSAQINGKNTTYNYMHSGLITLSSTISDKLTITYGAELTYTTDYQDYSFDESNIATGLYCSNTDRHHLLNGDFATISFASEKLSIDVGVRYEHSVTEYFKQGEKDNEVSRKYNDFLPNLNIAYSFTDDINISAGYKETIKRPNYKHLTDKITISDRYNYIQGNSNLRPFYQKSLNGVFAFYDFNIIASACNYDKYIADNYVIFANDNNVAITRKCNLDSFFKNTIGVEWSTDFGCYTPDIEIDYSHQYLSGEFLDERIDYKTPVWVFSVSNTFLLPQKITASFDVGYTTRGHDIFDYDHESWQSSIFISKKFAFGLTASVSFNNFFIPRTQICDTKRNYIQIYSYGDGFNCRREAFVNLRYVINNKKVRSSRDSNSSEYNRLDQ